MRNRWSAIAVPQIRKCSEQSIRLGLELPQSRLRALPGERFHIDCHLGMIVEWDRRSKLFSDVWQPKIAAFFGRSSISPLPGWRIGRWGRVCCCVGGAHGILERPCGRSPRFSLPARRLPSSAPLGHAVETGPGPCRGDGVNPGYRLPGQRRARENPARLWVTAGV
jgi:hypothetical protein